MASKYQLKDNSFYIKDTDIPINKYNIDDSETLHEIEKIPPEMTIYFLNKVIADKKYEGAIKNKAIQIISQYKR